LELERLPGRKTVEVQILKQALDLARPKNRPCDRALQVRALPKVVTEAFAVARSNVVAQIKGVGPGEVLRVVAVTLNWPRIREYLGAHLQLAACPV
jgi:hypothetical protein